MEGVSWAQIFSRPGRTQACNGFVVLALQTLQHMMGPYAKWGAWPDLDVARQAKLPAIQKRAEPPQPPTLAAICQHDMALAEVHQEGRKQGIRIARKLQLITRQTGKPRLCPWWLLITNPPSETRRGQGQALCMQAH